jgi:anaerobic selenocysteine-containing dehydrogenase
MHAVTIETRPSFCRLCHNACAILVEVEGGKAVRVTGDRSNPLFAGYTCVKGRAQPQFLRHPERLYHSMKRTADGSYRPIPVERAMDEIADRLKQILDHHGPRALAGYYGTMLMASVVITPLFTAFMDAIESPMRFTPNTIDKPGKMIAKALHGSWMAPPQGYHDPDVALLIGMNPPISYKGAPAGNPARWINDAIRRGMKLIVIDPRRTDVARRAFLHLQPQPGEDASIVAGLLRVILEEGLYDREFVAENVHGVDELRAAVEPFTSARVAARAGVADDDLVMAARTFASGRGYAVAGTGPNMSGPGTLVEYLVLALDTLCGHYLQAGEKVRNATTLLPSMLPRAQASPPRPAFGFGEAMRVRGLTDTAAGLPTAALPDEILLDSLAVQEIRPPRGLIS